MITDKTHPYTPRLEQIKALAGQIAAAMAENADLRLILGHGSGSYGHTPASLYDTRSGVNNPESWRGFTEVWYQASALNRLVVEALYFAGLPIVSLSPIASVTAHDGLPFIWDLYPLQTALSNRLLPVIYGDVVFDDSRGGTILSTEDLFIHLARILHPQRILLAGLEQGVWEDFPTCTRLLHEITPISFSAFKAGLINSAGTDVTGGMRSKVTGMLTLVTELPDLEVEIFSGEQPDNIRHALLGASIGTRLHC